MEDRVQLAQWAKLRTQLVMVPAKIVLPAHLQTSLAHPYVLYALKTSTLLRLVRKVQKTVRAVQIFRHRCREAMIARTAFVSQDTLDTMVLLAQHVPQDPRRIALVMPHVKIAHAAFTIRVKELQYVLGACLVFQHRSLGPTMSLIAYAMLDLDCHRIGMV